MTARHLLLAGALALPALFTRAITALRPAVAQVVAHADPTETFAVEPPAPWADADPADSLYRLAREALNRDDYRRAAALFAELTERFPRSS